MVKSLTLTSIRNFLKIKPEGGFPTTMQAANIRKFLG